MMKKEKYLQIFNYLREFSKLRSLPIRNLEQYENIIWFSDIPKYEIFDCITFPNFNQDADYWLKINKPKGEPQPPAFPKLSDTLHDWIVKESLTDEDGMPKLKESIFKNSKTILLSDKQYQNDLMRQKVLERCNWQFFRVRGAEYYSNRKKALEPLWKLLRTNDRQKEEPSITNKYQQNGVEEIKNDTVEIIQPVAKKTIIPQINKKVKQPQQMAIQEIIKDKIYSSEDSSASITSISIEDRIIEILSEEGPMPIWKISQTLEQPLEETIRKMEKLLEQGWVIKYYEGGVKMWKAID